MGKSTCGIQIAAEMVRSKNLDVALVLTHSAALKQQLIHQAARYGLSLSASIGEWRANESQGVCITSESLISAGNEELRRWGKNLSLFILEEGDSVSRKDSSIVTDGALSPYDNAAWIITNLLGLNSKNRFVKLITANQKILHGAELRRLSPPIDIQYLVEPGWLRDQALILQSVVLARTSADEGCLIKAVAEPWFEIIEAIANDPAVMYQISPRRWEEIVAGAYVRAGFDEVILTPHSGDLGRDVIATKRGLGAIRVIDQVKAYKPGQLVTANDVRALMGVLHADGASKGFVTTTSTFAPKLHRDPLIAPLIPSRLELVQGTDLVRRLSELTARRRYDQP